MKTSQAGIDIIKRFEGLELESYQDIAGIWTIGYGHTGPEVEAGQSISAREAEALLRHDLTSREKAVSRLTRVALNQNEFDALVSFIYNVGAGAYERSTARRRLNRGDRMGAADALTWFNKATVNGVLRPVTGLTRRRAAERALFITPTNALSAREEDVDSSTRITPIEDAPRRDSIGNSRTVQGAAIAGGAGVAATNMGKDASEELDRMETNIENGISMTDNSDSISNTDDQGETGSTPPETDIPELEGNPDPESTPGSENNSSVEGEEIDDPVEETSSTDNNNGTIEIPADRPAKHDRHEADAQIQFALMVIIVLAVLYVLFARFDDWRKYRR